MSFEHLDSYEPAIKQIAGLMVGKAQLDHLGHDRDDYASQLRMHSWKVQLKFRERYGFCAPAERRYVHYSLWNESKQWKRARTFRAKQILKHDPDDGTYLDEDRFIARQLLERLEQTLGPKFDILRRVGEAGGHIASAYKENDGNFEAFAKRVRRLRKEARKVLD